MIKERIERAVQATATREASGHVPGVECATCSDYSALVDKNAELVETTAFLRAELRSFRAKKLQQDAIIKELRDASASSSSLPRMHLDPNMGFAASPPSFQVAASPPSFQLASLLDVSMTEGAVMRVFIQLEQSCGRIFHKIELCQELMTREEIGKLIALVAC
jgi:hypothetical protein